MDKLLNKNLLSDRYKILNMIKKGGMGVVYLAEDLHLERLCAIKELICFKEKAEKTVENSIKRFKKEARMLAQLHHSNLPRVYDYFVVKSKYFLVMDYIEGKDLLTILDKEGKPGLPEEDILDWTFQLCEVLSYLHNQKPPIIYRDLKPSNIMLQETDKKIILIDFGIAIISHGELPFDEAKLGTLGYVSPEQCQGKATTISDIYSMGATIYHLLTGSPPAVFGESNEKLCNTSEYLKKIITKCLRNDPSERYQYVEAIYQDLNLSLKDRKYYHFSPLIKDEKMQKIEIFSLKEEGNLSGKEIYDILFSNYLKRSSAKLVINDKSERGEICFNKGHIVHASLFNLDGEKALHSLLTFEQAKVFYSTMEVNYKVTITKPTASILADCLNICNELQVIKNNKPSINLDNPILIKLLLKNYYFSPLEAAIITYLKNKSSVRVIAQELNKSYFQIIQVIYNLYKENVFLFSPYSFSQGALKVLIVEDDASMRMFIKKFLKDFYEFEIDEAADGIEGCMKMDLFKPDILFLDLIMPCMDGYRLCELIKTQKKIPLNNVIIISCIARSELDDISSMGFTNFLRKPFELKDLGKTIEGLLQQYLNK